MQFLAKKILYLFVRFQKVLEIKNKRKEFRLGGTTDDVDYVIYEKNAVEEGAFRSSI